MKDPVDVIAEALAEAALSSSHRATAMSCIAALSRAGLVISQDWQPIKSAPDEGVDILVSWDDGSIEMMDALTARDYILPMRLGVSFLTHWMPLPAPLPAKPVIDVSQCGGTDGKP